MRVEPGDGEAGEKRRPQRRRPVAAPDIQRAMRLQRRHQVPEAVEGQEGGAAEAHHRVEPGQHGGDARETGHAEHDQRHVGQRAGQADG